MKELINKKDKDNKFWMFFIWGLSQYLEDQSFFEFGGLIHFYHTNIWESQGRFYLPA
jgi:hypothetical protein